MHSQLPWTKKVSVISYCQPQPLVLQYVIREKRGRWRQPMTSSMSRRLAQLENVYRTHTSLFYYCHIQMPIFVRFIMYIFKIKKLKTRSWNTAYACDNLVKGHIIFPFREMLVEAMHYRQHGCNSTLLTSYWDKAWFQTTEELWTWEHWLESS